MTQDPEAVSIYDWAVTADLQPEPISVEVWRNLPEEFCRHVELVNGQVVRCEKPSRAHQAAASRITAMLDAAAGAHMERNPESGSTGSSGSPAIMCCPSMLTFSTTPWATTACTALCPQSRKPAPSTSPSGSRSTGTASPT